MRRRSNGRQKKRCRYRLRPVRLVLTLLCLAVCLAAVDWGVDALQQAPRPAFSFFSRDSQPLPEIDLTQLYSPNAILVDNESGRVLAERNSEALIYPASLTKMMTALVTLEQMADWQTPVTVAAEMFPQLYAQDASLAGFLPGEQALLQDLLYGMLLPSGAECCIACAELVSGSEQQFVELMNQKAQALGMERTRFCNTTGLHDDNQVTTVQDLAILLRYALQNERFRAVFTSSRYTVPATNGHPDGFTVQSNLFQSLAQLNCDEGWILGGKTGYTEKAGLCLATLARVQDHEYLLVTAGADGNHRTAPFHVLDALAVYQQLASEF